MAATRRCRELLSWRFLATAMSFLAACSEVCAQSSAVGSVNDARELLAWVARTQDNAGQNFIVIDKRRATADVFDGGGRLLGRSAVLLGSAIGDDSVPGIGTRPLSQVLPQERTTPAGRFMAEPGHNAQGEDIVWVEYDTAVSLHRVRLANPRDKRLERLATPTAADNRISYGCINVPVNFYEGVVRPAMANRGGVVYVLPEQKSLQQVFWPVQRPAQSEAPRAQP